MAERDFNLEMTGEQVKDALQQLEDRVAEGWAVGEHDGVPVTSGSPYYHNNSAWWAQQAGLSAQAAADSAATAEQEVEEGIREGIAGAYVQESATPGAVVTFDDGADNIPLKDLKVNLAINQPGTGDPSPSNVRPIYPVTEAEVSRTATNIWDEQWEEGAYNGNNGLKVAATGRIRSKNPIPIKPGTEYYIKAPANGQLFYYRADGTYLTYTNITANQVKRVHENAYFMNFNLAANSGSTYGNNVSINYPSTDHDYHSGAGNTQHLVNIGINQWDEETEQGYIGNDGTLGSDASSIRSANYCACIGGTQYCVVAPASRAIHWYDKDKTHLSYDGIGAPSTVVTAPANAAYFKLSAYLQGYPYGNNMSVNFPARFNTYNAYTGNVVYGGELDVTTGVLTARYASVDLGSLTWTRSETATAGIYRFTAYLPAIPKGRVATGKCTIFATYLADEYRNYNNSIATPNAGSEVLVRCDAYTDPATFKTAMAGHKLVYELATPISIQLTPTEVDTLRGDNVIWADCGDITNCEYRADLKMYIDKVVGA